MASRSCMLRFSTIVAVVRHAAVRDLHLAYLQGGAKRSHGRPAFCAAETAPKPGPSALPITSSVHVHDCGAGAPAFPLHLHGSIHGERPFHHVLKFNERDDVKYVSQRLAEGDHPVKLGGGVGRRGTTCSKQGHLVE